MSTTLGPAGTGLWTRHRTALLVGLALLAGVVVFAVLSGGGRTTVPLDPDNPGRGGAQALHRVLEQRGVEVTVVRSADAFDATAIDGDATVLVTATTNLGASTARRLLDHVGQADLVLAEPRLGIEAELGVPEGVGTVLVDPVAADCPDPLVSGLEVAVLTATSYPTPQGCFGDESGFLLAQPAAGVSVLGASGLLSNAEITDADNAAVALRLLGQHDRLVWYVPDAADLGAGEGVGPGALLPRWFTPALWLGAVALVSLLVWRGRRLGPLVTEPLPVSVTAIETTLSRGRLYRRAGDRAHAAHSLRAAACTRLAGLLGLPAGTDPAGVAHQLGARLGRPVEELRTLIDPAAPPPTTDRDLVELGSRLDELDREVRRA